LAVIGRGIRSQATSDPAPARWITSKERRKKWPTANKPKGAEGKSGVMRNGVSRTQKLNK